MPKKLTKKSVKKKLEKLVKHCVKIRDNYTCQYCKKELTGSNCHASHVVPVSRDGRLAFDIINLKVLCFHCHLNWWHKFPTESGQWFRDTFPERMEYLEAQHIENRTKGPITIQWYLDKIEYYKEVLEALENNFTGELTVSIEDLPF